MHPWDVDGARRAGLQSVWVNRTGGPFPAMFTEPSYTVTGVDEIVELLGLTACDPHAQRRGKHRCLVRM